PCGQDGLDQTGLITPLLQEVEVHPVAHQLLEDVAQARPLEHDAATGQLHLPFLRRRRHQIAAHLVVVRQVGLRLASLDLVEPPAESPSTRNSSDRAGSVSWQSASLPGSIPESSAPLRRVNSFALRAASRARSASSPFSSTFRAIPGFSSKHADSFSFSIISTMPLTSLFPSLVFVWPSNCGRGSL